MCVFNIVLLQPLQYCDSRQTSKSAKLQLHNREHTVTQSLASDFRKTAQSIRLNTPGKFKLWRLTAKRVEVLVCAVCRRRHTGLLRAGMWQNMLTFLEDSDSTHTYLLSLFTNFHCSSQFTHFQYHHHSQDNLQKLDTRKVLQTLQNITIKKYFHYA